MIVAVVGATGMVGQVMLKVLQERNFPVTKLLPVASSNSIGKKVNYKDKTYPVVGLAKALREKPDIALFSAGSEVSLEWAPKFADVGTTVIDNSSAWRMHENIKLVVPEINADGLKKDDKIIANPNCSTIQLVMALKPLHDAYNVKRVLVSTYQSITGTGVKAVLQLENEYRSQSGPTAYPYPIHKNALPHCDIFQDNDYTKEEMKLTHETKKILSDDTVQVVATAVRIPVVGGHSESINVEFSKAYDINELKQKLKMFPGIIVQDNPGMNVYPMPIYAEGKDEVFVGRIRRDFSVENAVNMWVVADNLRKGAATNAVQIAEYVKQHLL